MVPNIHFTVRNKAQCAVRLLEPDWGLWGRLPQEEVGFCRRGHGEGGPGLCLTVFLKAADPDKMFLDSVSAS